MKLNRTIIGMIHVDPLPGTPKYAGNFASIIKKAKEEAAMYRDAGVDMIAIENMHDVPYLKQYVGPEIVSAMSVTGYEVKNTSRLPCGIQILAGANKEALSAALSGGLDFIRAEGFVFSHIADEGFIDGCAGELLRYRKQIGAEHIKIFTDIKKKHSSHAITSDVNIGETAHAAEFFLSDAVIVTGTSTGSPADLEELRQVKESVKIPVLVGSGVTSENLQSYLDIADGLIVGSYFKYDGHWSKGVDFKKVKQFMDKVNMLRNG
ncbi:MAG: BtpA/SgcQ family protein [Candidatus Eremiobacterota bacterium]